MSWYNKHDKQPVSPDLMPREVKMPFNRRSLSQQAAEIHDEIERIAESEDKYRHHCGYLNEQIQKLQDQLAQMTVARNDAEVKASIAKDENSRLKERLEIGIKLFINALDPPAPPIPKQTTEELVNEIDHIVQNVERSDVHVCEHSGVRIRPLFEEEPPTPEPPIGNTLSREDEIADRVHDEWRRDSEPTSPYAPKNGEEMVTVGPPPQNIDNRSKRKWWNDRIGQIPHGYKEATVTWPKSRLLKPIDQALADVEDYMKDKPFDPDDRSREGPWT